MNEIKLLNLESDMSVIKEAWEWKDSAPKWFREMLDIDKEPWEEYLANFPGELHYGVFAENSPTAIVRLIEARPYVFNIHLAAKRKTDFNILLNAGLSIRDYLFDQGVNGFYGWVTTMNKGVVKLYESLGFADTGRQNIKGQVRGRDAVWKQYSCINPNFFEKYMKIH